MPWIRPRFRLTPEIEGQLLQISARSIDYRLRPEKRKLRRRLYGRTKPGTLLKRHIPLKTDHWDVKAPGFTEIDLASHSGNSASGDFCYSLNVTGIHTGWTETRAVLGKEQQGVRDALEAVRQALPFPLRGIDSDNGSEVINSYLWRYCQARAVQFTRGRPYKKDDNAHIEQKNWTHVRKLIGYDRYDTAAAVEAMNALYTDAARPPPRERARGRREGGGAPASARPSGSLCVGQSGRAAARADLPPGESPYPPGRDGP